MTGQSLRLTAPSRLHFGLLAWGASAPRQFGSVGLMIDKPGLILVARPANQWHAEGPSAERVLATTLRIVAQLEAERKTLRPLTIHIQSAPAEHVGLGAGTQIALSVARILLHGIGETQPSVGRLALLTGRGLRSGVGLHGFIHGGLIVDGGRSDTSSYPPLLARHALSEDWSVLVVIPTLATGLSGVREQRAFAQLPDIPIERVDFLCRLVLLGLLPAASEANLAVFGKTLSAIQQMVGLCFAPAQGGIFADPQLTEIIKVVTALGIVGAGQSSWGPTVYGFMKRDEPQQEAITRKLLADFPIDPACLFWTRVSNQGATLEEL